MKTVKMEKAIIKLEKKYGKLERNYFDGGVDLRCSILGSVASVLKSGRIEMR